MSMDDVDTPALIVDLDAFERNLEQMARLARRAGVRLRPHAKTHKSPIIGLKQMALGAVGLCCQKVSEAEVLVHGGVTDVLVSNEVIGARKLDRLAALARQATIMVVADSEVGIDQLAAAAQRADVRLRVLVEINVGADRCGVAPGTDAVRIAMKIAGAPTLEFAGVQAYYGTAQHFRTADARRTAIAGAVQSTRLTVQMLSDAGLGCDVVCGAGTGTFELEAASGVYTEIQPGSYCFMDADYARNRADDGSPVSTFEHALFVHSTVMSAPVAERAILDAGHKAVAIDSGMPDVVGLSGAVYERPSDEHGTLNLVDCEMRPRLGDKVLLIPGHCDPTVNLHDWYVGVRGLNVNRVQGAKSYGAGGYSARASVESVWPVAARGALF